MKNSCAQTWVVCECPLYMDQITQNVVLRKAVHVPSTQVPWSLQEAVSFPWESYSSHPRLCFTFRFLSCPLHTPLPVSSLSQLSRPTALLCSLASFTQALIIVLATSARPCSFSLPTTQPCIYSLQLVQYMPTTRLSYYVEQWRLACFKLMLASFLSSHEKVSVVNTFEVNSSTCSIVDFTMKHRGQCSADTGIKEG